MGGGNEQRGAGSKRPASQTNFRNSNSKAQKSAAEATASKLEAPETDKELVFKTYILPTVKLQYGDLDQTKSQKDWYKIPMHKLAQILSKSFDVNSTPLITFFQKSITLLTDEIMCRSTNSIAVDLLRLVNNIILANEMGSRFIQVGRDEMQEKIENLQLKINEQQLKINELQEKYMYKVEDQLQQSQRGNQLLLEGLQRITRSQEENAIKQQKGFRMLLESGKMSADSDSESGSLGKNMHNIFAAKSDLKPLQLNDEMKQFRDGVMLRIMSEVRFELLYRLADMMKAGESPLVMDIYNRVKMKNDTPLSIIAQGIKFEGKIAHLKPLFVNDATDISETYEVINARVAAKQKTDPSCTVKNYFDTKFSDFEYRLDLVNLVKAPSI